MSMCSREQDGDAQPAASPAVAAPDSPGPGPDIDAGNSSVPSDLRPAPEPGARPEDDDRLGDFTTTPQILALIPLALVVGALAAAVALALIDMIGLLTNVLYHQRLSVTLGSPAGTALGPVAALIPIVGGLVVGIMARVGSEQIRGHGIPEAIENILMRGSRVQPRLAVLKPVSSAISIGTGGPFGAEGPIILTGGAVGSIVSQLFHLTAAQRRGLLVAGASAGMSAVFGTPVAATLFGVELLAFELKPRSMVLIGIASATADALRMLMSAHGLMAPQPLFPVAAHPALGGVALGGAAVIGLVSGLIAWLLTQAVYGAEDLFLKLRGRLHWMWWPMIGGAIIGVGGLLDPSALGVGYGTIHAELLGRLSLAALATLFAVKLVIWASGLGSGTSGGVLAPILMLGAAGGGIVGQLLPGASPAVWAEIGMAGAMAGVMRSPFTAIVFSVELTHDVDSLLALLVACTLAHLCSVLVLKRSILTEKVARRGFHVMREYGVDPLEAIFVREVMQRVVLTVSLEQDLRELYSDLREGSSRRRQRLFPVVDGSGRLAGVLPFSAILAARDDAARVAADGMVRASAVAHADETLRTVADRMALTGAGVVPVVDRATGLHLEGLVTQFDLLEARQRVLEEERHAERVLVLRRIRPRPAVPTPRAPSDGSASVM